MPQTKIGKNFGKQQKILYGNKNEVLSGDNMVFGQFVEYKGYIGSIEYSFEDAIFYGKLLNTKDLVSYEGKEMYSLYNNYHEAVDDYIQLKKEIEKYN